MNFIAHKFKKISVLYLFRKFVKKLTEQGFKEYLFPENFQGKHIQPEKNESKQGFFEPVSAPGFSFRLPFRG